MNKKNTTLTSGRIIEFDALRAVSLFSILYAHANSYIPIADVPYLREILGGFAYAGLSIFVFLSGFGLYRSLLKKGTHRFDKLDFLKKRLLRIYPLYLVAVIIYFGLFNFLKIYHPMNLEPVVRSIVFHLMSFQIILFPKVAQMFTIWFIGIIVPFYILFCLTAELPIKKFIFFNGAIFLSIALLKIVFELTNIELMDTRLILYYPIFIAGCVASNFSEFFYQKRNYLNIATTLTGLSATVFYCFLKVRGQDILPPRLHLTMIDFTSHVYFIIYSFLVTASLICLSFMLSRYLLKIKPLIIYLSGISYAAYLMHRIIYGLAYFILYNQLDFSKIIGSVLFPFVTIFLFLVSDWLVKLEDKYLKPSLEWALKKFA